MRVRVPVVLAHAALPATAVSIGDPVIASSDVSDVCPGFGVYGLGHVWSCIVIYEFRSYIFFFFSITLGHI